MSLSVCVCNEWVSEWDEEIENLLELFEALLDRCSYVLDIVVYPIDNRALIEDIRYQSASINQPQLIA